MESIVFMSSDRLNFCIPDKDRHFEKCTRWINSPQITQWMMAGTFPMYIKTEQDWFASHGQDDKNIVFVLETLENEPIGTIGLHNIRWVSRLAELGIMIGEKNKWQNGYATEAEAHIIQYAFRTLNLRKLEARVFSDNPASLGAAKKNGFCKEGKLEQHLFVAGEYRDLLALRLFRSEWEEQ